MMDTYMGVEDWELVCSWPPAGDQWHYSVDQFFQPLDLLGNKSGQAEYQLFNDDVHVQNNFNSTWSDGSSFLEETVEQNCVLSASHLMSTAENVVDVKWSESKPSSPWEELPSSPESFGVIINYDLCREINPEYLPRQQLADTVFSQTVGAPGFDNRSVLESSDNATVPQYELSTDDMLLDLDDAVSDIIMDPLKLADIGLYLPAVSADDVESLLSSPSISSAAPAASPVGMEIDTESSFSVYQEQVSVASPYQSETELLSVSATCLPAYEEQVQVASPASSQSSISLPCSNKKQRKKLQNKTAAQKYRQKKRGEQGQAMTEHEQLEHRNIELRTRVEEMTREVDYLKGLIEEICA